MSLRSFYCPFTELLGIRVTQLRLMASVWVYTLCSDPEYWGFTGHINDHRCPYHTMLMCRQTLTSAAYDWDSHCRQPLSFVKYEPRLNVTINLLNPDMPCLCKRFRSRLVGFFRSQLIWIYTVWYKVCECVLTNWVKQSDWLKLQVGAVS